MRNENRFLIDRDCKGVYDREKIILLFGVYNSREGSITYTPPPLISEVEYPRHSNREIPYQSTIQILVVSNNNIDICCAAIIINNLNFRFTMLHYNLNSLQENGFVCANAQVSNVDAISKLADNQVSILCTVKDGEFAGSYPMHISLSSLRAINYLLVAALQRYNNIDIADYEHTEDYDRAVADTLAAINKYANIEYNAVIAFKKYNVGDTVIKLDGSEVIDKNGNIITATRDWLYKEVVDIQMI